MKSRVTSEICNGRRNRIVHTNHLRHRFVPETTVSSDVEHTNDCADWAPPSVDHVILPPIDQTVITRYPKETEDHLTGIDHKLVVKLHLERVKL